MLLNNKIFYTVSVGGSCCSYLGLDSVNGNFLVDVSSYSKTQRLTEEAGINISDIQRIYLTHTHVDHRIGLRRVKTESGAEVLAHKEKRGLREAFPFDLDHIVDQYVENDEYLPILSGARVIYTPGHASNHICLYLPEENILFTGDALQYKTKEVKIDKGKILTNVDNEQAKSDLDDLVRMILNLDIRQVLPGHQSPPTYEELKIAILKYSKRKYKTPSEELLDSILSDEVRKDLDKDKYSPPLLPLL